MASVIFRGAFIRHADIRYEGEAGKFLRLHMTSDFSDPVREHMGWEELAGTIDSAKLAGEIPATNMILTPAGPEVEGLDLDLTILSVDDFQVFRVKNEDGDSMRAKLRFVIRSNEKTGAAYIEQYIEKIGRGLGQLKISYPKQDELDLQPAGEKPAEVAQEAEPTDQSATEEPPPVQQRRGRGRPRKQRETIIQ